MERKIVDDDYPDGRAVMIVCVRAGDENQRIGRIEVPNYSTHPDPPNQNSSCYEGAVSHTLYSFSQSPSITTHADHFGPTSPFPFIPFPPHPLNLLPEVPPSERGNNFQLSSRLSLLLAGRVTFETSRILVIRLASCNYCPYERQLHWCLRLATRQMPQGDRKQAIEDVDSASWEKTCWIATGCEREDIHARECCEMLTCATPLELNLEPTPDSVRKSDQSSLVSL